MRGVANTKCSTPAEWSVLMALAVHAGGREGVAWPALTKLASMTGLNARHVRRCIRTLEARGVIERVDPPARLPATGYVRSRFYRIV